MKFLSLSVLIISCSVVSAISGFINWSFEDDYQDRLLFIHPFINYDYNAYWYYDWEKNLFKRNGFLFSVGSVTTKDLLVDGTLVINEYLGVTNGKNYTIKYKVEIKENP